MQCKNKSLLNSHLCHGRLGRMFIVFCRDPGCCVLNVLRILLDPTVAFCCYRPRRHRHRHRSVIIKYRLLSCCGRHLMSDPKQIFCGNFLLI